MYFIWREHITIFILVQQLYPKLNYYIYHYGIWYDLAFIQPY